MLASPDTKSALDVDALLVQMGRIRSDYVNDTDSSAESGATAVEAPMHATGADSGAGAAGSPVFPCNEIMQTNPCSFHQEKDSSTNCRRYE